MSRFGVFLLGFLWALLAQAEPMLQASVDRTRLGAGESLELTLESQDVTQFGKPDLRALEGDFEVRGTRQLNSLHTLDGETRASTRWIITLLPRRSGSLRIPELQLGQSRSQAIDLQVLQADASRQESASQVFIEATLDSTDVYVQAQAVLTLRIYHSVALYDDSSLSPLQLDNAKVEPLGESRTYEKEINGVRHGVIETRYAVYPQQSGGLEIPPDLYRHRRRQRRRRTIARRRAACRPPGAGQLAAAAPRRAPDSGGLAGRCAVAARTQPDP